MQNANIHQLRQNGSADITDRALAVANDGVVSVADLRAAGLSMHAISARCRSAGAWQRPFPRVVVLQSTQLTRRQFLRALLVHLGPDAVITGMEALRAFGARVEWRPGVVQVLVPANCRMSVQHPMVAIERTTRPPQALDVDGLAMAPPPRACADAARRESNRRRLCTVLVTGLRDGLCTPAELWAELEHGNRRGAAAPRAALNELVGNVASLVDRRAHDLVNWFGLPQPEWHAELMDDDGQLLTVVSAHWPDVDLSWDLSPIGHHRAILVHQGRRVVHTPPSALLRNPHTAGVLLEDAYFGAEREQRASDAP